MTTKAGWSPMLRGDHRPFLLLLFKGLSDPCMTIKLSVQNVLITVLLVVVFALVWHQHTMTLNTGSEFTPQVNHVAPQGNYQYHGSPYNNYNYDKNGNPQSYTSQYSNSHSYSGSHSYSSPSSSSSDKSCITYDGDYTNDTCN